MQSVFHLLQPSGTNVKTERLISFQFYSKVLLLFIRSLLIFTIIPKDLERQKKLLKSGAAPNLVMNLPPVTVPQVPYTTNFILPSCLRPCLTVLFWLCTVEVSKVTVRKAWLIGQHYCTFVLDPELFRYGFLSDSGSYPWSNSYYRVLKKVVNDLKCGLNWF